MHSENENKDFFTLGRLIVIVTTIAVSLGLAANGTRPDSPLLGYGLVLALIVPLVVAFFLWGRIVLIIAALIVEMLTILALTVPGSRVKQNSYQIATCKKASAVGVRHEESHVGKPVGLSSRGSRLYGYEGLKCGSKFTI